MRTVVEYGELQVVVGARQNSLPILHALSLLLLTTDADEVLVPAPSPGLRTMVTAVLGTLDPLQRARVSIVDTDGAIFSSVTDYLAPIRKSNESSGWPDSHLAGIALATLYPIAVAARLRAHVLSDEMFNLIDFLLICQPHRMSRTAQFRYFQLARLCALYEPHRTTVVGVPLSTPIEDAREAILGALDDVELAQIREQRGVVGFAANPGLILRTTSRRMRHWFLKGRERSALQVFSTGVEAVAEAAGGAPARVIKGAADLLTKHLGSESERGPLIRYELGIRLRAAEYALAEAGPDHTWPAGVIYQEQRGYEHASLHWITDTPEERARVGNEIKRHPGLSLRQRKHRAQLRQLVNGGSTWQQRGDSSVRHASTPSTNSNCSDPEATTGSDA